MERRHFLSAGLLGVVGGLLPFGTVLAAECPLDFEGESRQLDDCRIEWTGWKPGLRPDCYDQALRVVPAQDIHFHGVPGLYRQYNDEIGRPHWEPVEVWTVFDTAGRPMPQTREGQTNLCFAGQFIVWKPKAAYGIVVSVPGGYGCYRAGALFDVGRWKEAILYTDLLNGRAHDLWEKGWKRFQMLKSDYLQDSI